MILQTEKELKAAYPMMFKPLDERSYTTQKQIDKDN